MLSSVPSNILKIAIQVLLSYLSLMTAEVWFLFSRKQVNGAQSKMEKLSTTLVLLCFHYHYAMHGQFGKFKDKLFAQKLLLILEVEKEHGLSCTVFSRVTKPSNLDLLGGLSCDRLTQKILSQSKMKPRMKEEKRLEKLARNTLSFLNRM